MNIKDFIESDPTFRVTPLSEVLLGVLVKVETPLRDKPIVGIVDQVCASGISVFYFNKGHVLPMQHIIITAKELSIGTTKLHFINPDFYL